LDFKYGFFFKNSPQVTEIQESGFDYLNFPPNILYISGIVGDFINSLIDPQESKTSQNTPHFQYRYLFNHEVEEFNTKKSLDISLSERSYTLSLKKTLRSRHQSDFNKGMKVGSLGPKERVLQELHFKEFCKTLLLHFNNPWSVTYLAKKVYSEYFQKTYEQKLANDCHSELLEKQLNLAVRDFKTFVRIMSEVIILSYNLGKYYLINPETLITREAICNLILNDFYSLEMGKIFESAVNKLECQEMDTLKIKMKNFQDLKPENFDIPEKFCLGRKFENQEEIPYSKTIQFLKEIMNLRSPGEKIDHIMKTAASLFREINEFYEGRNEKIEEEMGGDEILAIFVYIVMKTQCCQLIAQSKLIDLFMTSNQMNSIVGYYLATIQVAIKYICTNKKLNNN